MLARLEDSCLVVVDVQPSVLDLVWERDRVVDRARFMIQCAQILELPVIVTEQNPSRLGGTVPELMASLTASAARIEKMTFSCWGSAEFRKAIEKFQRAQTILVGIETHICVNQTAHDLLDEDLDVIVCADAVSARTQDMHDIGMRRMSDEGAAIAHTESVVYEWLATASHPNFRDVLGLVKGS